MKWGRDSFYRVLEMDADQALVVPAAMLTITTQTEDAAEGVAAFAEKRAPSGQDADDGDRHRACTTGGRSSGTSQSAKERALGMGGAERVERQHSLGKLPVRERLDLLLDPGSFVEYGLLADSMDPASATGYLAADGVVAGVGEIDGRRVAVAPTTSP